MSSHEGQSPKELLELLLGHLGFVFEVEESHEPADRGERLRLNIRTRDPGRLIGRDGRTLDEVEYLLNRLIDRDEEGDVHQTPRIIVDVEGYRRKEQDDFLATIRQKADRVRETGKPETLPPMNAYERWMIHQAFQEDPEVTTKSVAVEGGNGKLKTVVLQVR
ncbi:spoIIIJ-associated protein [Verrucomicrobium sp. GAS474]|uniref:Jag family protein n=1 Tax=Verrucomicrobium sp. GAS474 TaxID=1882831 RepID=UPI00087CFE18|nr:R3H domain-containing nucleic acid-binding protein [Verrucomicrobium sp. GAS474]SDU01442.1 spoIIIJ-associated protein [Verrucomicrobium sp. GAS474]